MTLPGPGTAPHSRVHRLLRFACARRDRAPGGPRNMPVAIMITEGPGPRVIAVFDVTAGRRTGSTLGGEGSFCLSLPWPCEWKLLVRAQSGGGGLTWGSRDDSRPVQNSSLCRLMALGGANGTMLWSGTCKTLSGSKAIGRRPRGWDRTSRYNATLIFLEVRHLAQSRDDDTAAWGVAPARCWNSSYGSRGLGYADCGYGIGHRAGFGPGFGASCGSRRRRAAVARQL